MRGGRPPKFDEPRRPVTLTLPERILARLAAVDPDRASAIVKVVDAAAPGGGGGCPPVEVVEVAPGTAVILIGPSRRLREIPWVRLAEVSPGRHLVTLTSGTSIELLEVAILDLLESLPPEDDGERAILLELRRLLGSSRRDRRITKFEMLYVDTPAGRKHGATGRADRVRPVRTSERRGPVRATSARRPR